MKAWKDSEFIIWKCETRDELKEAHPEWNEEKIQAHLAKLALRLHKMGCITNQQLLTV